MKLFLEKGKVILLIDSLNLDNAVAGESLVLNRPGLEENKCTMAGPTTISKNGQMIEYRPPLPSLWADLYSTWNMAYVTR